MARTLEAQGVASEAGTFLEELLTRRRSTRAFDGRPLDEATLRRLLSMAQWSASWTNTQPWDVIITSGEGTERFRDAMTAWAQEGKKSSDFPLPSSYPGVYCQRRRECAMQLYGAVGVAWGDREGSARQAKENFRFFGAPHVALITSPSEFGTYGVLDVGIYIANFILSAEALGVGAVPQAALADYSGQIHEYFQISQDRKVVAGISFGYADPEHAANRYRTPRAAVDEAVRFVDN
jgi:nitroreductase